MEIEARYTFFPVGQGTFSAGSLHIGDHQFWWVYDCGCVESRQEQLLAEIGRLACLVPSLANSTRPRLDLLFVSHFDKDHVSGLVQLLSQFEVDTLVLPYLSVWDRLVLAASPANAGSRTVQAFLVDPLGFINALPGARIRRVYLVPEDDNGAGDNDDAAQAAPLNPPRAPDFNLVPSALTDLPKEEDKKTAAASPRYGFQVHMLARGASLRLDGFWEFVPYNKPSLRQRATPAFVGQATALAAKLRVADRRVPQVASLARLEKLYDRTFGDSAWRRNAISLFVHAGPLGNCRIVAASHAEFKRALDYLPATWDDPCNAGQSWICATPEGGFRRAGVLYTGDGFLNNPTALAQLEYRLGRRRMNSLSVLQVMHHGSRCNWYPQLMRQLAPVTTAWCADPDYHLHHPHREVWNSCSSSRRHKADGKAGFTNFFRLDW
jgi:hypothetical protein